MVSEHQEKDVLTPLFCFIDGASQEFAVFKLEDELWLCKKHPDGQWVTSLRLDDAEFEHIKILYTQRIARVVSPSPVTDVVELAGYERLMEKLHLLEVRLLQQTDKFVKQRCNIVSFVLVDLIPLLPPASQEPMRKHLMELLK